MFSRQKAKGTEWNLCRCEKNFRKWADVLVRFKCVLCVFARAKVVMFPARHYLTFHYQVSQRRLIFFLYIFNVAARGHTEFVRDMTRKLKSKGIWSGGQNCMIIGLLDFILASCVPTGYQGIYASSYPQYKTFSKFPPQLCKFSFFFPFRFYQIHFWNGSDKFCSLCTRLRYLKKKTGCSILKFGQKLRNKAEDSLPSTVSPACILYSLNLHLMMNLRMPLAILAWTELILRLFRQTKIWIYITVPCLLFYVGSHTIRK
jgi:hypothetical protein